MRLLRTGIIIGVTTLGYWALREYFRSDRTLQGSLRTARTDLKGNVRNVKDTSRRVFEAFKAGMENWSEHAPATDYAASRRSVGGNRSGTRTTPQSVPLAAE